MECSKCGVSSEEEELFDAIEDREVIKICERCSRLESIPLIKKPSNSQIKASEKRQTVFERLEHISGVHREKEVKVAPKRSHDIVGERTVKEIVEKRFIDKVQRKGDSGLDLINNFNWAITNARKSKRLTRDQVARAIGEKEYTLKMVENGVVSANDIGVITKLEEYLGIKVLKGGIKAQLKESIQKPAFTREEITSEPDMEIQEESEEIGFEEDETKEK